MPDHNKKKSKVSKKRPNQAKMKAKAKGTARKGLYKKGSARYRQMQQIGK